MLQLELIRINAELAIEAETIKTRKRLTNKPITPPKPLVTYAEICKSRKRIPSRARFRIYRELRELGFSFPSIGRAANYDHSSIIHGITRINIEEPLVMTERTARQTTSRHQVPPAKFTESAFDLHIAPV